MNQEKLTTYRASFLVQMKLVVKDLYLQAGETEKDRGFSGVKIDRPPEGAYVAIDQ